MLGVYFKSQICPFVHHTAPTRWDLSYLDVMTNAQLQREMLENQCRIADTRLEQGTLCVFVFVRQPALGQEL